MKLFRVAIVMAAAAVANALDCNFANGKQLPDSVREEAEKYLSTVMDVASVSVTSRGHPFEKRQADEVTCMSSVPSLIPS